MNPLEILQAAGEVADEAEETVPVLDAEGARLVALAREPELGEAIALGDHAFRLQFLSIESERRLHYMVTGGGPLAEMVAIVLQEQDPACDVAWVNGCGAPREDLVDLVEKVRALHARVPELRDVLDARRASWSTRTRTEGPRVDLPPDAAAGMFLEWACRTFAAHPRTIFREFSQALLLVLFDSHWWLQAQPPMPDKDGRVTVSDAEVFAQLGLTGQA